MKALIRQATIPLIAIFLASIIFYLPIIANPSLLLNRGNDLQEFFWPIYYFAKNQIITNHTLPLWNPMVFSGTPLAADPQSPLFYLPNLVFLVMPIDIAFLVSFFGHSIFGGIGMFLLARKGISITKTAALFSAVLYTTSPKLAGYLEAGHFGLATSLAWIPFLVLSIIKLNKEKSFFWVSLFSISLYGIFASHTITFIISSFAAIIIFLLAPTSINSKKRNIIFLTIGAVFTFGFTAISLLPQLDWMPETTRFLLLKDRDVYPKWDSHKEFISAILPPPASQTFLSNLDSEKWIPMGIFTTIFAIIGFSTLNRFYKKTVTVFLAAIILISLNNLSPIYSFLLSWDWYLLMRVSTRVWIVTTFIIIVLAGLGFQQLQKKWNAKSFLLPSLAVLAILETLLLSWTRFAKPIPEKFNRAPVGVYEFLKKDPGLFRVFCTNRCLSQQMVSSYNLQTIEGYGTLQQKNYYNQFIQLSQVFWGRYTLALPPFEIYNFRQIQPYAPELADYNVKYVISPHSLTDKRLVQVAEFDGYKIFENRINKSRAYFSDGKEAPILYYSPNSIKVGTSQATSTELTLAEVWSSGWKAYLNGKEVIPITEFKNALRGIKIKEDTEFVEFKYEPVNFKVGAYITLTTIIMSVIYILVRWKKLLSS